MLVDNFSTIASLSLDDVSSIIGAGKESVGYVAKAGVTRIVEGVSESFSNLRFLQLPARVVDMGLIVETDHRQPRQEGRVHRQGRARGPPDDEALRQGNDRGRSQAG